MMRAVRLHPPGGVDSLSVDEVEVPQPGPGEALVRVHAAAITRDELDWPTGGVSAIVSYELSGVVEEVAEDVADLAVGDDVFALTSFDRDGVAAEYAAVPASFLAPKPVGLSHVESAALPLAGLTAWQGLFVHERLHEGERVLILGAAGGVGHMATQLARWRGAHVIGTASAGAAELARGGGDAASGHRLGVPAGGSAGRVRTPQGLRQTWEGRHRGRPCMIRNARAKPSGRSTRASRSCSRTPGMPGPRGSWRRWGSRRWRAPARGSRSRTGASMATSPSIRWSSTPRSWTVRSICPCRSTSSTGTVANPNAPHTPSSAWRRPVPSAPRSRTTIRARGSMRSRSP